MCSEYQVSCWIFIWYIDAEYLLCLIPSLCEVFNDVKLRRLLRLLSNFEQDDMRSSLKMVVSCCNLGFYAADVDSARKFCLNACNGRRLYRCLCCSGLFEINVAQMERQLGRDGERIGGIGEIYQWCRLKYGHICLHEGFEYEVPVLGTFCYSLVDIIVYR